VSIDDAQRPTGGRPRMAGLNARKQSRPLPPLCAGVVSEAAAPIPSATPAPSVSLRKSYGPSVSPRCRRQERAGSGAFALPLPGGSCQAPLYPAPIAGCRHGALVGEEDAPALCESHTRAGQLSLARLKGA